MMELQEAEDVVADYGDLIERHAGNPTTIFDVRELPHPKEKIFKAIILMLRDKLMTEPDSPLLEPLHFGAVNLARYQEGVGESVSSIPMDINKLSDLLNEGELDMTALNNLVDESQSQEEINKEKYESLREKRSTEEMLTEVILEQNHKKYGQK